MKKEWNYFMCNNCFVMYPHLAVPEVCVCGNDMGSSSTRRKFHLTWDIKDSIANLKDNIVENDIYTVDEIFRLINEEFAVHAVSVPQKVVQKDRGKN